MKVKQWIQAGWLSLVHGNSSGDQGHNSCLSSKDRVLGPGKGQRCVKVTGKLLGTSLTFTPQEKRSFCSSASQ